MRKLETLDAWKRARETAQSAYSLTMQQPLMKHYSLADQIRRAAASIPANIAEGYALGTTPQFLRCLRIALGSAAELQAHLELVNALHLAPEVRCDEARALCERMVALLVGLVRSLRARSCRTLPASRIPHPD